MRKTLAYLLLSALLVLTLAGCSERNPAADTGTSQSTGSGTSGTAVDDEKNVSELLVRFGNSDLFTMHLEDNDTAAAVARHVRSAAWQLPIYHYDD